MPQQILSGTRDSGKHWGFCFPLSEKILGNQGFWMRYIESRALS